jgi:two-component system, chemotaxis family, protein-glutamate methylesterase/glutaminase
VLEHAGVVPARHPDDGEEIRPGQIYVAPPNHHLKLQAGAVCVSEGPRENRHRPAIDPLFRTAARVFGPTTIALVLSGNFDDGSAGLLAVRERGGVAIVQDPSDARAGDMPQRALAYAGADYVLRAQEIGPKLIELIASRETAMGTPKGKGGSDPEVRQNEETFNGDQGKGRPSVFACAECHGVLWEMKEGELMRYRCRVGHAYTAASLTEELDDCAERALWAAMRALEERAAMAQRTISAAGDTPDFVVRLKDQVEADTENARIIRKMIFAGQ